MPQDPAVIQRQIEQTRAELAETVDAIAEIVSPKRVAERANEQVRAKVAELRERFAPGGGAPSALGSALTGRRAVEAGVIEGGTLGGGLPGPAGPAPGADGAPAAESGPTQVVRTVRWERVALVTGVVVLLLGARRRRRRRR
ncbi:DUF3618 domain-containing protein [Parafrankia discariae]|uniref:DUF3618 domain-containing protein n=1 Tax=Parafrankia discariae TaxID=365528 RepID=UPI00037AD9F7|nr:DUF3618 domain-containing protein [Parafrankia discariae]